MKNLFYPILFALIFSCQASPETKFERDGVAFTCPEGWKITEQETVEDIGYYLTIEKDGLTSSGLVIFTWLNTPVDLEDWLTGYQEEMKNQPVYKTAGITFEEAQPGEFAGFETTRSDYSVDLLGVEHKGSIHLFYGNDKSIAILVQEATEDHDENKAGFRIIEQSFTDQ